MKYVKTLPQILMQRSISRRDMMMVVTDSITSRALSLPNSACS
jgi:hypothetical protein